MAAILRVSVVVVVVLPTRPRAIPLAMITMRKFIHGFPSLSYMGMGLRIISQETFKITRTLENGKSRRF